MISKYINFSPIKHYSQRRVTHTMKATEKHIRPASHAGSWYSSDPTTLDNQLNNFLSQASGSVKGARVLIGPHAGYTYAGAILAKTYKAWDTSKVKRVFLLGPSHHVYYKNVAMLSNYNYYETPFGDLPIDSEINDELIQSSDNLYNCMSSEVDEDEHSFEMHAPLLYKLTKDLPQGVPKIVPIMISGADKNFESKIAESLYPYFENEENSFIISSDFCHWGSRFGYTEYVASEDLSDLTTLSTYNSFPKNGLPIYKSIEFLDKEAMRVASSGSYSRWRNYINITGNTICGQKPIAIMLNIMEIYSNAEEIDEFDERGKFQWIGYTQSNKAVKINDSSVSYAASYARF